MKRFIYIVIAVVLMLNQYILAQSPSQIKQRCPSPNGTRYASISIKAIGDMVYLPCPNRSSIFDGLVDFSNATVTGLPFTISPLTTKGDLWGFSTINTRVPIGTNGQVLTADSTQALGLKWATPSSSGVTGSGTVNFVPRFTAASVIGNTPLSWSGSQYTFNNTALNSNFRMELTPVSGTGLFTVRDFVTGYGLLMNETNGRTDFNSFGVSSVNMRIDEGAGEFHLNLANGVQNSWDFISGLSTIHSSNLVNINGDGGINADSAAGIFKAGDILSANNNTILTVDDTVNAITINAPLVPVIGVGGGIGLQTNPFSGIIIGQSPNNTVTLGGIFTANRTATFPDADGTVQYVGAANTGTIMSVPLANSVLANATGTIFTSPCTSLALTGTTEGSVSCPVTRSGTVRNLYVRTGGTAKVNTPTTTITMRKNGSNQTVTLVMTETVNTTTSDTTHNFTVAAGDLITISISVAGAAAVSTSIAGITFEID